MYYTICDCAIFCCFVNNISLNIKNIGLVQLFFAHFCLCIHSCFLPEPQTVRNLRNGLHTERSRINSEIVSQTHHMFPKCWSYRKLHFRPITCNYCRQKLRPSTWNTNKSALYVQLWATKPAEKVAGWSVDDDHDMRSALQERWARALFLRTWRIF